MHVAVIWELGGGLGHIEYLKPIIAALLAADHRVTLIARYPARVVQRFGQIAQDPLFHLLPAPAPSAIGGGGERTGGPPESIADVLIALGYAEATVLSRVLSTWSALLAPLAPDLVISDFSPIGNLVARSLAPVILVGNGYTIPPPGPCLPFADDTLSDNAKRNEGRFVATINEVAQAHGLGSVRSVADLFRGAFEFVLTLSIFDPYRRWRKAPTLMPYTSRRPVRRIPFGERPARSAFIYLPATHAQLETVVETVRAEGIDADAYLSDFDQTRPTTTADLRPLRVHKTPMDLEILSRAQFVIHTGGLGVAHDGLLGGAAQILLPVHLEHELTAVSLAKRGLAAVFRSSAKMSAEPLRQAIRSCLETPSVGRRIDQAAAACPDTGEQSLAIILQTVGHCLSGRKPARTQELHS